MKDDRLYLAHMSECINRILEYTAGGRDEFMASSLIQDGVMRNLQILAESSQRISDEFKETHTEIDWRGMSGFRNVLVHDYLRIDLNLVWQVIVRDLSHLKLKVEAVLQDNEDC